MDRSRWWRIAGLVLAMAVLMSMVAACSSGAPSRPSANQGAAPAPSGAAPGQEAAAGKDSPELPSTAAAIDRMIIYTATVSLRVQAIGGAVETIEGLAGKYGGFVAASSRSEADSGRAQSATITLRVPADRFSEAMADVRAAGQRVINEKVASQDVTEEYADIEAQLRALRATEQQYIQLLQRANTVEDVLKVQKSLGEVRTLIDRLEGRRRLLENKTQLSTITVSMSEVPSVGEADVFDPGSIVGESFTASLRFLQALATILLRAVVFLWWLLIPVVILIIVITVLVRRRTGPARSR